jgi:hypothetical protein
MNVGDTQQPTLIARTGPGLPRISGGLETGQPPATDPLQPTDSFVPTMEQPAPGLIERPVMLAQATNPSMPYFPGGYNPTNMTGAAQLLDRILERSRHRLGRALNPNEREDLQMVFGLWQNASRSMGNRQYMTRQQAYDYLHGAHPNATPERLNGLLDNLATQTRNEPLFGIFSERNYIYADDIGQFLTDRRY